jgi:hypothetical protein
VSAEVVNIRQARKARRRQEDERHAAANRARFGRTKAERETGAAEASRAARALDGARIDGEEG